MMIEIHGKMKRSLFLLLVFSLFSFVGTSVAEQEESALPASPSLKLNGYIQVRYTHEDTGSEGFGIKRARLAFKGKILENISYKMQVDAVKSPILLDAQVVLSFIPKAKLAFGQFKVPFSQENLTSSSALDFINRSQTVKEICPGQDIGSSGRDIGVTLSGDFSWVEYSVGVFNGSGINQRDMNEEKDIVGRLIFRPFCFLELGVSHYEGKDSLFPGDPAVDRDRTGFDVFFSKGPAFVKGEYIFAQDDQVEKAGWYVRGGYSFIPDKLQAIINYDSYDGDLDIDGNRIEEITLGLNWFFSQTTKLQVNYEYHKNELSGATDNVFLAQFQAYF